MKHDFKSLDQHILEMRRTANFLVAFSFPRRSLDFEKDIMLLKQRRIFVDGYELNVHFNRADYIEFNLEILQITGAYLHHLPYRLVFKVAERFIGSDSVCFTEFVKSKKKKTYLFQVFKEQDDSILCPPGLDKSYRYEDFNYYKLDSKLFF